MSDGNGKFLRGVFWALLIGSFSWATAIGIMSATALNGHCRDAEAKSTDMKDEMIARDELMLKEISKEFKEINLSLTEIRNDVKWIKGKR